jgi:hypothetical protein
LICFILRKVFRRGKNFTVKLNRGNITVMIIVIYFFLFPYIVLDTITLFSCIPVDDQDAPDDRYTLNLFAKGSYMVIDTKYECWATGSQEWHISAVLGIALPSLIFFILGLPISLIAYLNRNYTHFDDPDFYERFGFIYVGLRQNKWYWFFLSILRTSILVCIGILINNPGYQNLSALFFLVCYTFLLLYLDPYELKTLRNMELLSSLSIITIIYLNMWLLETRETEGYSFNTLFSWLLITMIAITLIAIFIMAMFLYVAEQLSNEDVHYKPRDLSGKEVFSYFWYETRSKAVLLKKTLTSKPTSMPSFRKTQSERIPSRSPDSPDHSFDGSDDDNEANEARAPRTSFSRASSDQPMSSSFTSSFSTTSTTRGARPSLAQINMESLASARTTRVVQI